MWKNRKERVIACAQYIVTTGCTVRTCASVLGTSKSTVHKDVTERLLKIDASLYQRVNKVLQLNLKERHLRGGNATRLKYQRKSATKGKKGAVHAP